MPLYLIQDGSFPWDSDDGAAAVVEAETIKEAVARALAGWTDEYDGGDLKIATIEPDVVAFVIFEKRPDGTWDIQEPQMVGR